MMHKIIAGVIAGAGWIVGQLMVVFGNVNHAIAVIIISVLTGLIIYLRPWRLIPKPGGPQFTGFKPDFRLIAVFAAICALGLSIIGTIIVKDYSRTSIWLYAISGFLLFIAKPANERFFEFFEIPESSAPMQKWEPWFVLALFIISAWLRLYKMGDIPAVGGGNEGLILGNCGILVNKGAPYLPHIGGGTDWPTFTYYIGVMFANIFGWDIANFRISSAVFGIISIMTFYFLARRLTSPLSAAMTSLMYTVFLVHLTASRFFVPPVTVLFIPHIICLAILFSANKNSKWYLYLAAGLACGFSLQGYFPGRGVIALFAGWFLLMFITRQKLFYKASNLIVFLAGFILVASPVIYYAITNPDAYWGYVNSVNPSRTGGVKAYLNLVLAQVPSFTGMLYTRSASEVFWHLPYEPLFNPVISVLFSAGLFLSIFSFWKPVPAAMLIFFFGGMIPAMLGGGGSAQPNSIRALMAFPVVFLICAFSFERLRRIVLQSGKKWLYVAVVAVGIAASLWSFQKGYRDFFRWCENPVLLVNENHHHYLMGKELKKYPGAVNYVSPLFVSSDAAGVYLPRGASLLVKKYIDDMMLLQPQKDHLLLVDPFYTDTMGLFKKYFPNAVVTTYREKNPQADDAYFEKIKMASSFRRNTDRYVPYVYLSSVFIPKQDVVDFQTMLYVFDGKTSERTRVFDGADFSGAFAGRRITLKGAFLIPPVSVADLNSQEPCVISLGWPGWKLVVDGKEKQFGSRLNVDSGIHFFELSGTVPAGKKGELPLSATHGPVDLIKAGQVVAIDERFGARIYHSSGGGNWDKPASYSHRLVGPDTKMYDGMSMHLPFSLKAVSFMKVPIDGEYEITGNKFNRFRILVNGFVTYDNMTDPQKANVNKIMLSKANPARIEVQQLVEGVPSGFRALTVYVKGPGMEKPEIAPYDWFYPVD